MAGRKPIHVCLVSLGCPKNLVDSEWMLGALAQAGCVVGAPMDAADVIVVNTCGFLAAAREESRQVIAEALDRKRRGRVRRVVVAGCLASHQGTTLRRQWDSGIDAVVGVDDRRRIVEAVLAEKPLSACRRHPRSYGRNGPRDTGRFRLTPKHTAYLRIAEGCSRKCTFCLIPSIRGPLRSKPVEMILAEARELIADGAVELNVIAQDTTAYGEDLHRAGGGGETLASLLRRLDRLDGVRWIRLLYTYPRRFDDELIDALAESEHVVPYLDMPLQHIATRVLRRMGRGVTRRDIETLLEKLRRRIPSLALRTSFIAGFPGETETEFRELVEFVRSFRFAAVGVFEYSPEPGTPAARLAPPVPPAVAAQRAEALMAAQRAVVRSAHRAMVRRQHRLEVLVDGPDAHGRCIGRHAGQAPEIDGVCFLTHPRPAGTILPAVVTDFREYDLIVQPFHQGSRSRLSCSRRQKES